MKKCPYCAEEIQEEAIVCKHCGQNLTKKSPEEISRMRAELTRSLAELEKNLFAWEHFLYDQGQLANDASRQLTWAYIGIIVGIFLVPVFGLGSILVLAGILAAITQSGKRKTAESNQVKARQSIEEIKSRIVDVKTKLAEL